MDKAVSPVRLPPEKKVSRQESLRKALKTTGLSSVVPTAAANHVDDHIRGGDIIIIFLVVLVSASPFALIPLRVCLKIDSNTTGSWVETLNLLWVVDGFIILWVLGSCGKALQDASKGEIESPPPSKNAPPPNVHRSLQKTPGFIFISKAMLLITLLSHISIALRLDHAIDWQWTVVLLPWILGSTQGYWTHLPIMVQLFFLALKLDHFVSWSWPIVFLPTWIGGSIFTAYNAISMSRASGGWAGVACLLLSLVMLTPFILLTVRLTGVAKLLAVQIVAPWFVLLCCGFLTVSLIVHGAHTDAIHS
ncbi:hypothetical protein AC1031_016873 [Aphanomyces cochlioides]|nr:hypothetical protein AC1031_016873 [Aphanomyces cochlioides]